MKVLITAGASGIGYAIARAFADEGAQVWITDVDELALFQISDDWRRTLVDASDEAGMARLFETIQNTWGGLDVLCANAGIAGPTAPVEDVSLRDWQRCVSVNLEGAFLAAKHAAPMMKAFARRGARAV